MQATVKSGTAVVNFTQFQLETHVEKAIRRAWASSDRASVDAGDLLLGALLVARTESSSAFRQLSSMLPVAALGDSAASSVPALPVDLAALPVSSALGVSFSVAEAFFKKGGRVWGRDYLTLALLAKDDPSLEDLAAQASTDISTVRQRWFEFVTSQDQHRKAEEWRRWWRAAGVAAPSAAAASEGTATGSYLFTWNPARYPFQDLDSRIKSIESSGSTNVRWSTGGRRTLTKGERVFLLRQDEGHRGLVGIGEVDGPVIEAPHWDENERAQGKKSFEVDVQWMALSREPLLDLSSLIAETGDATVWSTLSGGVGLTPAVAEKLEAAWPRAWERRLRGLPDDLLPQIEPRHWIPRFDADTDQPSDRLKVNRYVNAFARVMASCELTPPMSIGLFGDWGSGKTYFMDRLSEKIDELAQAPPANPPLYWNRICQMRFNAWHYTETNLWASLVTTIFNQLCTFLDPPETDADQFNRLLNQLEVVQALRKEANDKLVAAASAHDLAVKRVAAAEKALTVLAPAPALSDADVRAILAQQITQLIPGDAAGMAALLEESGRYLGRQDFLDLAGRVRQGTATVEEARQLLGEAASVAAHATFWWRVLNDAKLYKTAGFWGVVATLVAIPFAFSLATSYGMPVNWAHAWTLVGEGLTLAGSGIAWAHSRLARASSVFDRLASTRARIERSLDDARSRDRRAFEKARTEAAAAERIKREELEQLRREEARAAEEERKAEAAVRESTTQARLGRFIRERTSSADYEKHLGLIAMIHRDFDTLSKLMGKARTADADPSLPRIDRIILYIDDLDRCHPPKKVVRVLEAVHLLLFFPLFVVVVGVDSRWVSRSLYCHYKGMLADEAIAAKPGDLQRPAAESQDFLEKIFQVPFWLRRMDPIAVQRLLHELITSKEMEAASPPLPVAVESTGPAGGGAPPAGAAAQTTGTTVAEDPGRAAAKRTTAEAEIDDEVSVALATPSESLRITERELQFMDRVAPLMPRTPRSVKRFVNIYRLYKAALAPQAFARFTGTPDRPGNFRAVQVLLALVTGTPRFAQRVFNALHGGNGTAMPAKLSDLVGRLDSAEDDEAWQTTLNALREFARENDLDLSELRQVAPLVSRYSVHHMISNAPGDAGLG